MLLRTSLRPIKTFYHTQKLSQMLPSFSTKLIMAQIQYLYPGIGLNVTI